MANEAPDPLDLKSWEDAFQYPIPVVRKLEQQLRNHADENREKLRNLVGVSYRDLLGTAERIIDMDAQMQKVEAILGQTGQKSNARAVGRISKSFGKLHAERRARLHERNSLASQLAVLECCPIIISRILKQKGSLLLAAKLVLLSRLTHKTLSQLAEVPPVVERLRDRLASLRRKLLRAIDKRFSDPEREPAKLVDDMCAFSLATSSTPTDVLRHFHHIRLEAIRWHLSQGTETKDHTLKALRLFLRTLHQSQQIFPKRLSESLVRLKDQPLVQQLDVQSVSELNFEVHSRWLTDELQNYTPWPRHDELQKSEADKLLRNWAKSAQQVFISGLKSALIQLPDFEELLSVRQALLEAWPWTDARLPGLHSGDIIDELRKVFNDKLSAIIKVQVQKLKLVCTSSRITAEKLDLTDSHEFSLWRPSLTEFDVTGGAAEFKDAILSSCNGTDTSISEILRVFEDWIESVKSIQTNLKHMRDIRWDDDLGDDDDDDKLDSRQALLSEDDPRTLSDRLSQALKDEAEALLVDFADLAKHVSSVDDPERKAILLLRVLRDISKQSSLQDQTLSSVVLPITSSADMINPLHSRITSAASAAIETVLADSLKKQLKAPAAVGRVLWEGNPQLPVQPSAMTFKLLKALTVKMAVLGPDLWSETAVDSLKLVVSEKIATQVTDFVTVLSANQHVKESNGDVKHEENEAEDDESKNGEPHLNGDDSNEGNGHLREEEIKKEKLTQVMMDLNYLQAALSPKSEPLIEVVESVRKATGLQQSETARLRKSAMDYWKRTYLLFALLAQN